MWSFFLTFVIILSVTLSLILLRNSSGKKDTSDYDERLSRREADGPKEVHLHIQGEGDKLVDGGDDFFSSFFGDLKDKGKPNAQDTNNIDNIKWEDVIGQEKAKQALKESAVWPRRRPELFVGARSPPKGILLFGPPGTGKTMLAKAVATNLDAKFYPITGAQINDKHFGESEKIIERLFADAEKQKKGSVIFIDEIDSILRARSSDEHAATRKVTTQILTCLEGVLTKSDDSKVLVIGATNRPYDLDEAALRRFPKRIRVDLPEKPSMELMLKNLIAKNQHTLTNQDFSEIAEKAFAKKYNGSDLKNMGKFAAMESVRRINEEEIETINLDDPRLKITRADFDKALNAVQSSVSDANFAILDAWEKQFSAD